MNISSHMDKLRRLEGVRNRLDPLQDFELWFWATMNAGTHAINAALHAVGATDPGDYFPTQPGVYLVDDGRGGYSHAFRPLGDVLHVGRPPVDRPVPEKVRRMIKAMEVIERHRDPCVRGEVGPTSTIIAECDDAYRDCLRLVEEIVHQN